MEKIWKKILNKFYNLHLKNYCFYNFLKSYLLISISMILIGKLIISKQWVEHSSCRDVLYYCILYKEWFITFSIWTLNVACSRWSPGARSSIPQLFISLTCLCSIGGMPSKCGRTRTTTIRQTRNRHRHGHRCGRG